MGFLRDFWVLTTVTTSDSITCQKTIVIVEFFKNLNDYRLFNVLLEGVMMEQNNLIPLDNFELSFSLNVRRLLQWFCLWISDNHEGLTDIKARPHHVIYVLSIQIFSFRNLTTEEVKNGAASSHLYEFETSLPCEYVPS